MVTCSSLGPHGRLSNQIFQIHAVLGAAELNGVEAALPEWAYEQYFETPLPHGPQSQVTYAEDQFHYKPIVGTDIDLYGYWQSEKFFPRNGGLKFNNDFLNDVSAKWLAKDGGWYATRQAICIHIRRGDYVRNENYYQLPVTYYINALQLIKDWQDYTIVILSDDIPWCKVHFECLPSVFFAEDFNDIESMALGSLCDHFILSNSSFSWWTAYLGETPESTIIHPGHLFAGKLLSNDTKDFWPERWIRFQKDSYHIDAKDCTFTIPVFMDSRDRKANLDLSVCMLMKDFSTTIVIGEQGGDSFGYMREWCQYHKFELPYFHRTKMLNDMAIESGTPFIANWDCDIILPPMQIYLTLDRLRKGADMVFPYDGRFSRWERTHWFRKIQSALDIGATAGVVPTGSRGKSIEGQYSVGGAVFFNKASFISGGMENEHMISFGPEDCERNDRFTTLGYKIERTGGCLYHIDHWCGPDSSKMNPYFKHNHAEIEKIRALDKDLLRAYIKTWKWVPKRLSHSDVLKELSNKIHWADQQNTGFAYFLEWKAV